MSNNVELGHKQWFVDEDILKDMCVSICKKVYTKRVFDIFF
jgi:hypothetical protein